MKQIKRALCLVFALCIVVSQFTVSTFAAATTTPTGYASASDVVYKTASVSGKSVIYNWGARDEVANFLSSYAQNFYTGSNTYSSLSQKSGGTSQSNAPSSALYSELKNLMSSAHNFYTYYNGNKNVRNYYKYTDCVSNDTSKVSLIYLGKLVTSTWNAGSTWNQEHIWPQSKLSSDEQIGDIMHLRPADPSENSSRGNTAYGESSGYYDPAAEGSNVRGDCARMVLYMYVRWGVTSSMWGKSGVIESVDVLLEWMEEDPVDTWEMGRNDAVQSITGTRNVFVDYPELAWLLFGEEVPSDMTTPSGIAANSGTNTGNGNNNNNSSSSSSNNNSSNSNNNVSNNNSSTNTNDGQSNQSSSTNTNTGDSTCTHERTEVVGAISATCTNTGNTGNVVCERCGAVLQQGNATAKTAHYSSDGDDKCDVCFAKMDCVHRDVDTANKKEATCTEAGYTGDEICADCGAVIRYGVATESLGEHVYGEWTVIKAAVGSESGLKSKTCSGCGESIVEVIPAPDGDSAPISTLTIILIVMGGVLVLSGAAVAIILIVKKKKQAK